MRAVGASVSMYCISDKCVVGEVESYKSQLAMIYSSFYKLDIVRMHPR